MADTGQRTEQPTQRRIEKARREGQFLQSREFVSGLQFAVFVLLLVLFGPRAGAQLQAVIRFLLERAPSMDLTVTSFIALAWDLVVPVATPVLILGLTLAAVSVGVGLLLSRGGLALKRLSPDLNRLNPVSRLKQLPQRNLQQALYALFLLPFFALALYGVLAENLEAILRLPLLPLPLGFAQILDSFYALFGKAAGILFGIGAIDLVRQKRKYVRDLRMTRHEVKEEWKEAEGDPQVKMRIRRMRNDLLRRRMMREVETATAVIVNPTHYAVAIRYRPEEAPAPKVVAKGKNYLALRIRHRAQEHQVPIIENPPLARALYGSAEVGQEIPPQFYRAVAEVLAYIYRLTNSRMPGQGSGLR
jgi:flagellar biosynthetic protein FlhB